MNNGIDRTKIEQQIADATEQISDLTIKWLSDYIRTSNARDSFGGVSMQEITEVEMLFHQLNVACSKMPCRFNDLLTMKNKAYQNWGRVRLAMLS